MSLFSELVATSAEVAATRSRRRKTELLASYLAQVNDGDIGWAAALLSGLIPPGALGVGWATLSRPVPPASEPSLTLTEVVATFDRLAGISGSGSQARRNAEVSGLLGAATAEEQRFLFGLIGGEIRQGALEGSVVEALARATGVPSDQLRRALMLDGRIWEVASVAVAGGSAALADVGLTLFRPLKPMLAQSAEDVGAALERTGPAGVEWKLDGVRIQVHRRGEEVEIYTRNLNRVTDRLGEVAEDVRRLPGRAMVLDGEALWLDETERPARFQDTAGRFGTDQMPDRGLRPFFFDILHLDGRDLIDEPASVRRSVLESVVGAHVVPHRQVASAEEAAAVLAEALEAGHEGVVVKGAASTYEAGRRGAAWVKVKPVDTLDLVVLAAEWGHGRRHGWLSNLHLGARHEDGFVMLGKTFKGLTDQTLAWQTRRLQEIEERRTKSTVFVRPELVVEIALDGVQVSSRYPGGVALRFARLRSYRPDKDPAEADTLTTVRGLGGLGPLA